MSLFIRIQCYHLLSLCCTEKVIGAFDFEKAFDILDQSHYLPSLKNLIARLINFKQMYSQILKGVPASVKKIYCDNIFYAYYAKAFSF